MPRLFVIADANAYIGLADQQLDALLIRERANGVVAWASLFVVDELIARSAHDNPREAGKGASGLRRLAKHCNIYDGSHYRVNFLTDPRAQIGELLFGTQRRRDQDFFDMYGTVVQQIAANPDPSSWPDWLHDFAADMRNQVEEAEKRFSDSIWNNVVRMLVPGAQTWSDVRTDPVTADAMANGIASEEGYSLCTRLLAENLAEFVGVNPSEERLAFAIETLKSSFPLAMRVFNTLLYRIAKNGIDASKPNVRNTVWDMQLGLSIPNSADISPTPVWIVTRDQLILTAAQTARVEHIVHPLERYLSLTSDTDALLSMIAEFDTGATIKERVSTPFH